MSQTEPELSSTLALSVLELLDEEPMHPYEMASKMRARHHDEFIRLNFGTLYHTVEVLERNGWIHPVEREKEGRRPERTVYELTSPGREVLIRTLGELLREPRREYPQFAAGLMFMHHLTAPEAAAHLKERAAALDVVVTKFETVLRELLKHGIASACCLNSSAAAPASQARQADVHSLRRKVRHQFAPARGYRGLRGRRSWPDPARPYRRRKV